MIIPHVLATSKPKEEFVVETKVWNNFAVYYCRNKNPAKFWLVGHWSRTVNDAEKKYNTMHKGCLAVVWAVLLQRSYFEESRFIIRTDHQSLPWIQDIWTSIDHQAHCRLCLIDLCFKAKHRFGQKHNGGAITPIAYKSHRRIRHW